MSRDQVDYLTKKLDQVIKRKTGDQFSSFVRPPDNWQQVEAERTKDPPVRTRAKREENRLLKEIDEEIRKYVESPALPPRSREEIGQAEFIWPGICMSDIARETGLTLGGVSRIFNGLRKARRCTLKSIANLYCDGDIGQVEQAIIRRVVKQINRPMSKEEKAGKKRQQQIRVIGLYEQRN